MKPTILLELRRSRSLLVGLVVVALVYGGVLAFFYPVFRDNDALVRQYLGLFPKEAMAAFGMEGSLADPGIFFNTYLGSMLWPIIAGIAGIVLATRPVAADLDRGYLELPLAAPISRPRYLAAAIAGQLAVMAVLAAAAVGGVLAAGRLVDAPFDGGRFALAGVIAFAFGCAIAGVTTLLAVVTLSRGRAGGLAAGLLVAMYLAEIVAKIRPDLDWAGRLSVFHYLRPTPIIDSGAFPLDDMALLSGVAVGAWALALAVFARRDLAA